MDYTIQQPGIYLKVSAERGFSKKEVSIGFGQGGHLIVPVDNVFYKGAEYFTRVILKALPQNSQLARVEIESLNGVKKEYSVSQKDLKVITKEELIGEKLSRASPKLKKVESILNDEAYLEVLIDSAYTPGGDGVHIKFDKGGAQKCSVAKWRTFFKNKNQGLIRVRLRDSFTEGLEKIVKIEIPTTNIGKYRTSVPSRYLHLSKPDYYR